MPVPPPPPVATPGVPAKTSWQPFPPSALGDMPSAPPLVLPLPTAAPIPAPVPTPTPTTTPTATPTLTPPPSVPTLAPPAATLPPVPPVTAPPTVPPVADAPIGTRVVIYQKPAGGDRAVTAQDEPKKDEPKAGEEPPKPPVPRAVAAPIPDPKPTEIRLLDDALLDAEILRTHNAKQLEMYNRKRDPERTKPRPMTAEQLPPSEGVRRMLAATEPPGSPVRSTVGAPPSPVVLEPGYVVHRRLYFEEKNSERYGWEFGIAQPFISAGYFYKDLLLYPMKLASNHRERYDTNAGKAMAGSPVPYLLYPPELTFGGMVIGSTAIVGTVFLLP